MQSKDIFTNKIWKPATSSSSLVITIPVWFRILYDLNEGDKLTLKKTKDIKEKIVEEVKGEKGENKDGIGFSKLF